MTNPMERWNQLRLTAEARTMRDYLERNDVSVEWLMDLALASPGNHASIEELFEAGIIHVEIDIS